MKADEKKAIIKRYNERLKKYGDDPRTLGWMKGRQEIRFKVLCEIGNLNSCSILDIGCGFGDLYGYVSKNNIQILDYLGVDINSKLIDVAKVKYPTGKFMVIDLEEEEFDIKFDYIISSGVFNYPFSDAKKYIENMLKIAFNLSLKGIAFDFISTYVDYRTDALHYSSPEDIFGFIKRNLTKRAVLRHDYLPYEFCIYAYKDDTISERNVFTAHEG